MGREKISATIITFNEEGNIRACLESISWADEIIVVDSGSTDKTVDICRGFTDKVFFSRWEGMIEQKNFAVSKATNNWIFSIDADERVTEELKEFTLKEMERPSFDGYRFPRQNYFLGKWLKHGGWYPDHVLRLFDKNKGHFGGINPHDKVVVGSGKIATVPLHIRHFPYKGIAQYVRKQNLYSTISAEQKFGTKKSAVFHKAIVPGKTVVKFIEIFFIKKGFLDGFHGFIVAVGSSYATFLKYVKLWELMNNTPRNDT